MSFELFMLPVHVNPNTTPKKNTYLWYLLKWACWTVLTSAAKSQTGFLFSSVSPVLSAQIHSHYNIIQLYGLIWPVIISSSITISISSSSIVVSIISISIISSSSIDLVAQQLWYPRAGPHVGPPHPPPSRVVWCRHPSEPHQREVVQRGSEAVQDSDQRLTASPALY